MQPNMGYFLNDHHHNHHEHNHHHHHHHHHHHRLSTRQLNPSISLSLTGSLIWILILSPTGIMSFSANDMVRLRNDVLKNYTVGVLPLRNQSIPLPVKMSFFLIMIHDLNMKNQVLTASGWLKFEWCDEFLQWTPEDYGGIDELILFQKEVWLPDIFVENTAQHYREIGNTQMLISVSSAGTIHWEPGIITETSCAVNIGKYPFDMQTCNIRFLTWMHTNKTLTVSPEFDTINLDALLPNGEWDIIKTEARLYKYPSTYRPGYEHTGVTFVVHLRRKRFFYVLNTIVPVVMLSCLNVLVFILPSDCGERMALAVTVLLAFTVYLGIISDNIPKTSESLSLLAIYLTSLLALSTASVVCAGIVLNIHYRDPSHPVPRMLGWFFSRRNRRRSADDPGTSRASCGSFDVLRDPMPNLDRRPTHIWDQRRPSIWAKRQIIREGRRESRDLYYDDHYAIQEHSGSDDEDSYTDTNQRNSTSFISEMGVDDSKSANSKFTEQQQQQQQQQQQNTTAHDRNNHHVTTDADSVFANANDVIRGGGGLRKDASIRHLRKKVSYDKISHHEYNSTNQASDNKNNHKKRKGSSADDYELETSSMTKKRQDYKYYSKKTRSDTSSSILNHQQSFPVNYPRSHSATADDIPWEVRSLLRRREMEEAKSQKSKVTWHDIGNSLDRWLFWVFFTLTNTVTVVILVLFIQDDI